MPYFSKSDLLHLQNKLDIKLDKHRGQCYLIDKNIIEIILQSAQLNPLHDTVLEIGAGLGILSDSLIQQSKQVFLIENDQKIVKYLFDYYSSQLECIVIDLSQNPRMAINWRDYPQKVVILFGDALELYFPPVSRIVANIPYQISAPLLFKILREWKYDQVTLMVQAEFADRLLAPVNSKQYSRLAASTGLFVDITAHHTVSPNSFFPPPKVNSKIISLRAKPGITPESQEWLYREWYLTFLRGIFPFKNKSLRNAIKIWVKNAPHILEKLPWFEHLLNRPEEFQFLNHKLRTFSSQQLFSILLFGLTGELALE